MSHANNAKIAPENIQPELPPQLATQPARTPLARPAQRHLRELDAHHGHRIGGGGIKGRMLLGKERDLPRRVVVHAKEINRLAPRLLLSAIELAKVKNMSLHDTPFGEPTIFDHTPVEVLLAIFAPR